MPGRTQIFINLSRRNDLLLLSSRAIYVLPTPETCRAKAQSLRETETEDKQIWEQGTLLINGIQVRYCVKHYPEPSETYGIESGRISIMELRIGGRVTLSYSRGWDIEPEDEASQLAYMLLLKKDN